MRKLIDLVKNPSGFDSMANYFGDIPESSWLILVTRARDSDVLTESNFECALERLGGESETVEIFRFGHWACGYWEALCVRSGSKEAALAAEMHDALKDYPVLDDDDFSERETEAANEVWRDCYSWRERLKYIRKRRNQFDFRDLKDLLCVVRGEYFNGYASEIL